MKRLFTIVCIAVICNYAPAQTTDAALASVEQNKNVRATPMIAENNVQVAEVDETANEVGNAVNPTFKLPIKSSTLNSKVGPNGEDLFMKGNKYYYLNANRKKIRVKSSALRDRPKTS